MFLFILTKIKIFKSQKWQNEKNQTVQTTNIFDQIKKH